MKEKLRLAYQWIDFAPHQKDAVEKAAALAVAGGADLTRIDWDEENRERVYGEYRDLHSLLVLLDRLPQLVATYKRYGIPEDILRDTLEDILVWMRFYERKTGRIGMGIAQPGWLNNHFSFKLFRLGRLQFIPKRAGLKEHIYQNAAGEIVALAQDGMLFSADGIPDRLYGQAAENPWTAYHRVEDGVATGFPFDERGIVRSEPVALPLNEWQEVLKEGDWVLDIHIYEGDPLIYEEVGKSLEMAKAFFPEYLGIENAKAFTCSSWLLDWTLEEVGVKGNIIDFEKRFYHLPSNGDDAQTLQRVFGGPVENWENAPEDTTLKRLLKKWYLSGKRVRSMRGIILI